MMADRSNLIGMTVLQQADTFQLRSKTTGGAAFSLKNADAPRIFMFEVRSHFKKFICDLFVQDQFTYSFLSAVYLKICVILPSAFTNIFTLLSSLVNSTS